MKRKIEKYLNSKGNSEYSDLEKIFEMYLSGNIKKLLSKYDGVGIYPTINKLGKTIQVSYHYHNIFVVMDFFEDKYDIAIYPADTTADDVEKLCVVFEYPSDFNLERVISEVDGKIKNHPKLKDTTLIEKKKKAYSLISRISLCFSALFCGSIGLYCAITGNRIEVNLWWVMFFIVIPVVVWFIFDVKSKRLK